MSDLALDALFSQPGEGARPVRMRLIQGLKVQLLIDHHVNVVVQNDRLSRGGEYPLPELDLWPEGRRIGKGVSDARRLRGPESTGRQDEHDSEQGSDYDPQNVHRLHDSSSMTIHVHLATQYGWA